MELNGYRLLLPEGTLDYFDLVDVKESVNEVVIYLEEKNIVPEKYTDQDTESKGFYDPIIVQDFPLRGKKVFLNIRRRRWLLKKHNEYISRNFIDRVFSIRHYLCDHSADIWRNHTFVHDRRRLRN